MTIEDPTPEAQEFVDSIVCRTIGRDVALALDAWGAALLRRQEEAKAPGPAAGNVNDQMRISMLTEELWSAREYSGAEIARLHAELEAEKAAHAVTRSRLEFLEGYRSVVEPELEALKAERVKSDEQIEALVRQRNLIQMRQDALRGELDATRKELVQAREALVQIQDAYSASRMGAYWRDKYRASQADLESLRKPLEGELAWAIDALRTLTDFAYQQGYHEMGVDPVRVVEVALRAKGEPQAEHSAWLAAQVVSGVDPSDHLNESDFRPVKPQAAEPASRGAEACECRSANGPPCRFCREASLAAFLDSTVGTAATQAEPTEPRAIVVNGTVWRAEPREPATPASELPRRVEPGTPLQVGARYRITEVASWDKSAEHAPGDELLCSNDDCTGTLEPVWQAWGESYKPASWFAHSIYSGTYVTGLELVAEPGEGE